MPSFTSCLESQSLTVSVVIVSYNSGHVLAECLSCLPKMVEIIVVDNNSADDSVDIARDHGATAISLPENVGFGPACNLGARTASGAFVFFVNPDVKLDSGAIEELSSAAMRYPNAGVLAPRIVHADGSTFCKDFSILCSPPANVSRPRRTPSGDCSVEMLLGAALFCRRDLFLELGGFDERIFLYFEDDDLCRRIRNAGWSLVHAHDAVARHGQGNSTRPKAGLTRFASFHWAVSKSYVARKHGAPFNPAVERRKAIMRGCLAALRFNPARRERYFGLAAGYTAVLNGALSGEKHHAVSSSPVKTPDASGAHHEY
jgi:N-acetylglucosaminyl-diphospho-decaprenol L-rhamnosyltransferase